MKIPASELSMSHIGKTVTVTAHGTTISGPLRTVTHEANLLDDTKLGDNGVTRWVIGASKTTVTILPDHTVQLARGAEIELKDTP